MRYLILTQGRGRYVILSIASSFTPSFILYHIGRGFLRIKEAPRTVCNGQLRTATSGSLLISFRTKQRFQFNHPTCNNPPINKYSLIPNTDHFVSTSKAIPLEQLHQSSTMANLIKRFPSFYDPVLRLQLLEAEATRQATSPKNYFAPVSLKLDPYALSRLLEAEASPQRQTATKSRLPSSPAFDVDALIRLLDDDETPKDGSPGLSSPSGSSSSRKFDIKECKNAYELRAEVPGLEQKNIEIEFMDAKTLVIKGSLAKVEDTKPNEDEDNEGPADSEVPATIEDKADDKSDGNSDSSSSASAASSSNQTTVEEWPEEEPGTEIAKKGKGYGTIVKQNEESFNKYLIRECSTEKFKRTFTFLHKVDRNGAKASLKNGILTVMVPKQVKKGSERKKIEIGA